MNNPYHCILTIITSLIILAIRYCLKIHLFYIYFIFLRSIKKNFFIYDALEAQRKAGEKTLYNYVDGCLFDIRNIDLPRKVKYRPRYKEPELKIDRGCRFYINYVITYFDRTSKEVI